MVACLVGAPLRAAQSDHESQVLIVGAGISGLSAALEAARNGATVRVIDMASVFGGHAVMSEGGVSVINSPMHEAAGLKDSADIGYKDFVAWGEDVNEGWARFYVENSRKEVFDWLRSLGVEFERFRVTPGNTFPRFHEAAGRGLGLVAPIYRECLKSPNIAFSWNTQVTKLNVSEDRVRGAETKNTRTGAIERYSAHAVILATGGFQNNLALLRAHWPKEYDIPERLLLGSGINSVGLGHALAEQAGARLSHLEYQWIYPWGLPDPRDPSGQRGMSSRNTGALWVNARGRRFVNEIISPKLALPEVLRQPGGTYWAIFDEGTKQFFYISGTDWREFATIERVIFSNSKLVKSAQTLSELGTLVGIPSESLVESVARYNELVTKGDDVDQGRFGPSSERFRGKTVNLTTPPRRIENPPYYAVQYFPVTRKNNGGVKVDMSCRVLGSEDKPIPGLYAVGELTGSGGMNGKAGLEGVWLGPGVLLGRVAGKAAANERAHRPNDASVFRTIASDRVVTEQKECIACHKMGELLATPRAGYWHFEKVHTVVLTRKQDCIECHADLVPNPATQHRLNPLVHSGSCASCHGK